jgi:hypothetical protein
VLGEPVCDEDSLLPHGLGCRNVGEGLDAGAYGAEVSGRNLPKKKTKGRGSEAESKFRKVAAASIRKLEAKIFTPEQI